MQDILSSPYGAWMEWLLPLAAGSLVMVALAAIVARGLRSAVWQRTAWQVAALGLVLLVTVELTGMGPAIVRLCRAPDATATHAEPPAPATHVLAPVPDDVPSLPFAKDTPPEIEARPASRLCLQSAPNDWVSWVAGVERSEPPETRTRGARTRGVASLHHSHPEISSETKLRPSVDASTAPVQRHSRWWPGLVWLAGAALVFVRIAWARCLLALCVRRGALSPDPVLRWRLSRLARRLGVARAVNVLELTGLRTPAVFGIVRPTVVLPAGFAEQYDVAQQEAMLAHEAAHLASGDPAWKLLVDLLCAVLWWHPAVWWLRRRLRSASETAADEATLLVPGGPDALAACLVCLGQRFAAPRRLGWLSIEGSGFRSSLGRRVERLLELPSRARRGPRRAVLLAAKTALPVAMAIAAVFCTAWARPQAQPTEGESTMNVVASSWRRSLAAVAVVAILGPISGDVAADERPLPADSAFVLPDDDEPGERRDGDRDEGEREVRRDRDRERDERAERRERERADRDMPPPEKLERRLEELKRAHHEAAEAGRKEEAARIEREGREIMEMLEKHHRRRPDRPDRERLMHRLEELKRAMHQAAEAGQAEKAEALEREARKIANMLEHGERPDRPEREKLERRLHELIRASRQAAEADEEEKAEHLEREARKIKRVLEERGPRDRPERPDDVERRMHHVRVAAENLREAGFPEEAERLMHEAERALHELQERERRPHPDRPEPAVEELREEVRQIRREMHEMRMHLEELLERDRDDDREDDREDDR